MNLFKQPVNAVPNKTSFGSIAAALAALAAAITPTLPSQYHSAGTAVVSGLGVLATFMN